MAATQVVMVHGIRTSATMWRAQSAYLNERGNPHITVDLPGHGSRMYEPFALGEAFATIDSAVRDAASRGPVLLVAHSMGGLLSLAYAGAQSPPPIAGLVASSCTAGPRGAGLALYRALARGLNALPNHGSWLSERVLTATLPPYTRHDYGAGGFAYHAQDDALGSLAQIDVLAALRRIEVPIWFVNGQWDQLRIDERLFHRVALGAELIIFPRTTHLLTAMRPAEFNLMLNLALATLDTQYSQLRGG